MQTKPLPVPVLQSDHTYKPYVGRGSSPSGLVWMFAPAGVWHSEMYLWIVSKFKIVSLK